MNESDTTRELLPLGEYTHVIVSYSGGKDSLACVLHLIDLGVDPAKIELWHNHVDGEPGSTGLMDWPCTEGYVRATGAALGMPVRFSWKDGGFEGEMNRRNSRTAGVYFEDGDGVKQYAAPSERGQVATRELFPQVSADLSVRWCSPYLKIDVAARAINNDPRFKRATILFVTGERRQESAARSKYREVEPHRCDGKARRVDQWRAVIDWSEAKVWAIIERHRLRPHPAYQLGWGRVSCMKCVFGDADQWASNRKIDPEGTARVAGYERLWGKTIKRGLTVIDQADKGTPFAQTEDPTAVAVALSRTYPANRVRLAEGEAWTMPSGAFKRCGGPT